MNNKKLTILEIGTTDTKGGAALVSWELKSMLEKLGHEVYMAVGFKRSADPKIFDLFDAPLNRLISKIIHKNFYQRLSHHIAYHRSNDISIPFAKKISHLKILKDTDVIHAHNLHSNFFNLRELPRLSNQKPFVWTLHDMWAFTGHNAYTFDCEHWQSGGCACDLPDSIPPHKRNNTQYLWDKKKKIFEKSKLHIVVPSQWLYNLVKKSILKHQPLTLIYNGIDTDTYYPKDKKSTREKLGLPLDKKIIMFSSKAGKKFIRKGWDYAEKIIEDHRLDDTILFLCIGGKESESIRKNIKYIPYISDPHLLAEYYSASDVLIFTSIAENCPLTVLEAMACGLPVLAFATGGIPELIVHKKTGYVAEYKNKNDLQAGFEYLITMPQDKSNSMTEECRKRVVRNFSLPNMTQQYLNLYQKILYA
ncbi:MAG: Glycosyl transferase group 1 [Parcubacteria group bacterium GW2011_GWA2_38_13]|nr:MAG: Glycosyl transferase group 1 [Parcubacteria group bacterium GW2011_GWA2_38_13]